jgi:hypothetical protein
MKKASNVPMSSSHCKYLGYMCGHVGLERGRAWGRGESIGLRETGQSILKVGSFKPCTDGYHPKYGLFAFKDSTCKYFLVYIIVRTV